MIYQINLQKGEIWSPKGLKQGEVKILHGLAWVTYAGVETDYVLKGGSTVPRIAEGMLIEALEDLVLEIPSQPVMTSSWLSGILFL